MIATALPLSETFRVGLEQDQFSLILNDFIDRFREDPSAGLLEKEPALLADSFSDEGLADAWLAAAAVFLAQEFQMESPEWTRAESRFLAKPWFAARTHNLKAILLQESPAAFRVRNLFVSANALSRA